MDFENKKIAGLLLFVGAAQFVLAAIIAEALDTNYTFSQPMNWLGGGSAGLIFNSSLFLLGLFVIVSAYLVQRAFKDVQDGFSNKLFWFLMTMMGVGAAGIGIFNENLGDAHVVAVRIFWVFAVPTAIMSYKFQKKPLSYASAILGLITLTAVILFLSEVYIPTSLDLYLGIGRGGMQRMIQYPVFLWVLGFGANLIGEYSTAKTPTHNFDKE